MRYVLAVLTLGAALTFAASAALAGDSVHGYPLVDEPQAVTLVPAADPATVAGPSDAQPSRNSMHGENFEGGR